MSLGLPCARLKRLACICTLALAALMLACPAWARAEVPYLPNVTAEMSEPSFWTQKLVEPNRVLASPTEIQELNQQLLADSSTNMNDLKAWPQDSYNGISYGQALKQSAYDDAQFFYNVYWARYDQTGHYYASWEEMLNDFYQSIIDNCANENATETDELLYGICTTRGYILCFPTSEMILDDPVDPDFDYQYQTALRINEPVIIQGISNDGQYYHVISSCTQGWVSVNEIALCASRDQWLDAWDIPDDEVLVVYDDKIHTEESNYAPQTSDVMLPMGTCLRLASQDQWDDILAATNRSGHNNHVVWLPVRNDDGTYDKHLALIPEHCKVSEGYLPLTCANLISVSLNYLGDAYGWGGMLASEDCSGYVRDVYRCFGIDLPRNTTWQSQAPVLHYRLAGLTDEQKIEIIKALPPGSTLFFSGHEMTYLGCDDDKLYVISNISSVVLDDPRITNRIRCCVINTLDGIKRRSGNTWLASLEDATVPFYAAGHEPWSDTGTYRITEGDDSTWKPESGEGLLFVYERFEHDETCFDHFVGASVDGTDLDQSAYDVQSGSVRLTLKPSFLATLAAGSHNLVAHFDDGDDVAATFHVAEAQTYAVATESEGGGTVFASPASGIPGTAVTITMTPDEGYASSGVTLSAAEGQTPEAKKVNANTYTFTLGASDVTVRGTFTAIPPVATRYAININHSDNGSASAQKSAEAGTVVTVTLTPQVGYASQDLGVAGVDSGNLPCERINENTYTFVMPAEEVAAQATFTKVDTPITYGISVQGAQNGTIGTSVPEAEEGEVVTITLVPDTGYASKGVSVLTSGGASVTAHKVNENTYTFVMPAQRVDVSATFAKDTSSNGGSSGSSGSSTSSKQASSASQLPKTDDAGALPITAAVLAAAAGFGLLGTSLRMRRRS